MSMELWTAVLSWLTPLCPNREKCTCTARNGGVHEIPLCLHDPSNELLGTLKIEVVGEAPVIGDEVFAEHGLEATMQKLRSLLVSDFVFNHTVLGLSTDFRWGQYLRPSSYFKRRVANPLAYVASETISKNFRIHETLFEST